MAYTFDVYQARDGWRWRMKAGNGEIVADPRTTSANDMSARFRSWWATARSSLLVHRYLKWVWIALLPVSYVWRSSIIWVVFMSHYAILTGHWSAEESTKVEVTMEEAAT